MKIIALAYINNLAKFDDLKSYKWLQLDSNPQPLSS